MRLLLKAPIEGGGDVVSPASPNRLVRHLKMPDFHGVARAVLGNSDKHLQSFIIDSQK